MISLVVDGYWEVHTIEKNIYLKWFSEENSYNIFQDKIRIYPGFITKSMNLQSSIQDV
jgi:hypothetical protein